MSLFTRRVESGSFPLYRFIVLGVLISAVLQLLFWSVPVSVAVAIPTAFIYPYWALQAIGACILLLGLYTQKALRSLHLERTGAVTLSVAGLIFFAAVWIGTGMIPLSSGSWMALALSCYLGWRVFVEIPKEIRAVERAARKIFESGDE